MRRFDIPWTLAVCFSAVWIAASSPAAFAQQPVFRFTEPAGAYAVGFKIVEQYDRSRAFQPAAREPARPLQTLVWYPAQRTPAKPMTVGDYLDLWATETSFEHPNPPQAARDARAGMSASLRSNTWAVRDAAPASGHFPVVIYAPSASGVSWENADLCEYLASHGYLVVASPSMGATSRAMTFDREGADAHAHDISFLIDYARTLPGADISDVAVIGHSWGGIANVVAAAHDARIDALVGLDGSVRYFPGLIKEWSDVRPERMTAPLLFFEQRYYPVEEQEHGLPAHFREGPSALNAWTHGDLMRVHMLTLAHRNFASMAQRNENKWRELIETMPMVQGDFGHEDAIVAYGLVARYTLQFLNSFLKHDAAAASFLQRTPAENGAPAHTMVIGYRAASP